VPPLVTEVTISPQRVTSCFNWNIIYAFITLALFQRTVIEQCLVIITFCFLVGLCHGSGILFASGENSMVLPAEFIVGVYRNDPSPQKKYCMILLQFYSVYF
jgi:hypothetical protein